MKQLTHLLRSGYELLVAGCTVLQSPFLLALRLYIFWPLFLTGKGKLENIGKVTEFFGSLGIPLPAFNAYFIGSLEHMANQIYAAHSSFLRSAISVGPYPEPRHRNHACPGWLLDRWDSDERKSVGSEIS
jgi:hypothetical protein